jgi:6-bladed beta-propeller
MTSPSGPSERQRSARRAVVVVAAGLVACGGDASPSPARSSTTDSAGVQIVRGPAVDVPLPWRLTEQRRFGGADSGAQSFTRASRYTVATDGRALIAVLDGDNDNRISVFDARGTLLRAVGQRGGGPGETEFPNGLQVDTAGGITVFDESKSALVAWGPDGPPLPERQLLSPRGRSWGSPRLSGDTLYILITQSDSTREVKRLERWTSRDTIAIDSTVTPKPKMVMFKCVGLALPPLFSPELEWTLREGQVVLTKQARYVVEVHRAGRLVRSIRRDIVPVAARTTDASRLYPQGLKVQFGSGGACVTPSAEVGEKVGVAETLPVVRAVATAPDGSVWVERYTFDGETPAVDVFSADGQYVGTLTGRPLPLGFLGPDQVIFPITNADDGTTVIGVFQIAR